MSTINVNSQAEAEIVLNRVDAAAADFRPFFNRLERAMREHGMETWDRRFGIPSLQHAQKTIEQRASPTPGTYYGRNSKGGRARSNHPYFEWTGSLREAVDHFTKVSPTGAMIDADANYRGPISVAPFSTFIDQEIPESNLFGLARLDERLDRELESWVEQDVIPEALRR